MNYVEKFNIFGVEVRQRPCLKGKGVPSTAVIGTVGDLYIDEDTGTIYKCTGYTPNGKGFLWDNIVGNIANSELGIIYSEDELKEHTDSGIYTFTLNRFTEDTELREAYESKPGILINSFDSELTWNGSKYETSSLRYEKHTLAQCIYYPSTGEIIKRTAVLRIDDIPSGRSIDSSFVWNDDDWMTTYATKKDLLESIGEALEGEY